MALDSGTKWALGISIAIGVGGLAYYLLSNKGKSKIFGKKGKIDYIKKVTYNGKGGTWIHLDKEDRQTLQGKIKDNDFVVVKGTSFDGEYKVDSTWTDAKGYLGAILLDPKISYEPKNFYDQTFKNTGVLIFK
jgi:hypothetical protein